VTEITFNNNLKQKASRPGVAIDYDFIQCLEEKNAFALLQTIASRFVTQKLRKISIIPVVVYLRNDISQNNTRFL